MHIQNYYARILKLTLKDTRVSITARSWTAFRCDGRIRWTKWLNSFLFLLGRLTRTQKAISWTGTDRTTMGRGPNKNTHAQQKQNKSMAHTRTWLWLEYLLWRWRELSRGLHRIDWLKSSSDERLPRTIFVVCIHTPKWVGRGMWGKIVIRGKMDNGSKNHKCFWHFLQSNRSTYMQRTPMAATILSGSLVIWD